MYRDLFRRQGAFEHPTIIHLTDRFIEITCGENHSKNEYTLYTHCLCLKDCLALRHKKSILCIIYKKEFPDEGAEWMKCLESNGVKKQQFWDMRRWWPVSLFLFLLALTFLLPCHANEEDSKWLKEKAKRTACISHLRMLSTGLTLYAFDNDNCLPPTLRELNGPLNSYCLDETPFLCPKTKLEYKYVPYRKLPATVNPVSLHSDGYENRLPLLVDGIGSHYQPYGIFLKKYVWKTHILYADGHIEIMDNLRRHMDIYEQHAEHLHTEDAEVLKKCCEEWDNKTRETTE